MMGMHDGHAFVTGLLVLLGHGFGMFAASGKSRFRVARLARLVRKTAF